MTSCRALIAASHYNIKKLCTSLGTHLQGGHTPTHWGSRVSFSPLCHDKIKGRALYPLTRSPKVSYYLVPPSLAAGPASAEGVPPDRTAYECQSPGHRHGESNSIAVAESVVAEIATLPILPQVAVNQEVTKNLTTQYNLCPFQICEFDKERQGYYPIFITRE